MGLETTKPYVGLGTWTPPEQFIFLNQTPHLQSKYVIFYTLGFWCKDWFFPLVLGSLPLKITHD